MAVFAYLLAFIATGLSVLTLVRVRSLTTMALWIPKALAGLAASFLAFMGALGAALWSRLAAAHPASAVGASAAAALAMAASVPPGRSLGAGRRILDHP